MKIKLVKSFYRYVPDGDKKERREEFALGQTIDSADGKVNEADMAVWISNELAEQVGAPDKHDEI